MRKNIISLFVVSCVLAACASHDAPVEYVEYAEYTDDIEYQPVITPYQTAPAVSTIKYSVPRDGDLTLETRHHIIQIQGDTNKEYEYHVWAGDKTYAHDPDLIVTDDNIMVLKEEE